MQNLSDNELDELFRKAAQESEGDSEDLPSDWTSMADRLERVAKPSGFWRTPAVRLGTTVLVIGTLSLSLFLLKQYNAGKQESDRVDTDPVDHPVALNSNSVESTTNTLNNSTAGITSTKERTPSLTHHQVHSNAIQSAGRKLVQLPFAESIQLTDEKPLNLGPPTSMVVIAQGGFIPGEGKESVADTIMTEDSETALRVEDEISTQGEENSKRKSPGSWLALKASAAPDFSSIGFSSFGEVGWNYGALLEFHFNNRLSLAAGVLRSRKLYSGTDLEYNGYAADKLEGDCRMWDIPVNFYYHFPSANRWSFYSGIGLSSYIMSREKYVYYVDTYYGQHEYTQDVAGKNKEWFKVLNISLGIEKQLTNHFALQIEPYIKAPLAGVGEGDVSLASFGAFFSLKYNFVKDRK
jgi:hypothetical protein